VHRCKQTAALALQRLAAAAAASLVLCVVGVCCFFLAHPRRESRSSSSCCTLHPVALLRQFLPIRTTPSPSKQRSPSKQYQLKKALMCYFCHTLKNNPGAPPHRGEKCTDARNTHSKIAKQPHASTHPPLPPPANPSAGDSVLRKGEPGFDRLFGLKPSAPPASSSHLRHSPPPMRPNSPPPIPSLHSLLANLPPSSPISQYLQDRQQQPPLPAPKVSHKVPPPKPPRPLAAPVVAPSLPEPAAAVAHAECSICNDTQHR